MSHDGAVDSPALGFTKWFNMILVEEDDGSRAWVHDNTSGFYEDAHMETLRVYLERRMADGTYHDWLRENGRMMSRAEFNARMEQQQ